MKRWRKHIICLLMLTVPLSLWAAVPDSCDQEPAFQASIPMEHDSAGSGHAHHGSDSPPAASPAPQTDHSQGSMDCDCCGGDCLEACTMAGSSALQARQFEPNAISLSLHFAMSRNSQVPGAPDYPSLYRPPIAQI